MRECDEIWMRWVWSMLWVGLIDLIEQSIWNKSILLCIKSSHIARVSYVVHLSTIAYLSAFSHYNIKLSCTHLHVNNIIHKSESVFLVAKISLELRMPNIRRITPLSIYLLDIKNKQLVYILLI